jgi:hypothetical protein
VLRLISSGVECGSSHHIKAILVTSTAQVSSSLGPGMQSGGPPNSPRGVLALLASSKLWRQHSSSDQQPEIGPDCTPVVSIPNSIPPPPQAIPPCRLNFNSGRECAARHLDVMKPTSSHWLATHRAGLAAVVPGLAQII